MRRSNVADIDADGRTRTWEYSNMKLLLLPASALLTACMQSPAMKTVCESPRPEICIQVVMPVCATDQAGVSKTASNACIACRDPAVIHYTPQACEADAIGPTR